MNPRAPLSRAGALYVTGVVIAGCSVVLFSLYDLFTGFLSSTDTLQWVLLAALTLLSGSATVKLPSVPATISISETFVFTSVLLFGPAAGAVIVALDGLIISSWFVRRRRDLHRVLFNVAAPALSIYIAAGIYFGFTGVKPLAHGELSTSLFLPLAAFTVSHFLINSWLIALAVAFETSRPAFDIWRRDFLWLSLNYFGGASVSALFVLSRPGGDVDIAFIGIIVPLLLILYFTFKIPMARVEDTNKHLGKMNSLYLSTIETLAMAIDAKDQVTHGHIRRVQAYAVGLARELRVSDEGLLRAIEASALLHDMGKLAIPEHILNKPGKLSVAEFEKMKLHAGIGADILSAIEFPYPVIPIVRHHHENWDGSGYPVGLRGTDIPIGARILAVVDCYDALTSDRPYRPKLSDEAASAILLGRRGTMYDPLVVDTFIRVHNHLVPIDSDVQTQQGEAFRDIARLSASAAEERDAAGSAKLDQAVADLVGWCLDGASLLNNTAKTGYLIDRLMNATGADAGLLASYDDTRDDLLIEQTRGFQRDRAGHRLVLGQGITGWVAANRQVMANSDAALDLGPLGEPALGLKTGLSTPLLTPAGSVAGVLTLYSKSPFSQDDVRLLRTLSPGLAHVLRSPSSRLTSQLQPATGLAARDVASSGSHPVRDPWVADRPACVVMIRHSACGDRDGRSVVTQVRQRMKALVRSTDHVYHWSPTEVLCIMSAVPGEMSAQLSDRLWMDLIDGDGEGIGSELSIGVAIAPEDAEDVSRLIVLARERATPPGTTLHKASVRRLSNLQ